MDIDGSASHKFRGKPSPNNTARKELRDDDWTDFPSASIERKSDVPDKKAMKSNENI